MLDRARVEMHVARDKHPYCVQEVQCTCSTKDQSGQWRSQSEGDDTEDLSMKIHTLCEFQEHNKHPWQDF